MARWDRARRSDGAAPYRVETTRACHVDTHLRHVDTRLRHVDTLRRLRVRDLVAPGAAPAVLWVRASDARVIGIRVHLLVVRPRRARDAPEMRPRYARDTPEIRPRYALDTPEIRPRYAGDTPEMRPRYARDTLEIRPRCARDTPEIRPRHEPPLLLDLVASPPDRDLSGGGSSISPWSITTY